MLRRVLKMDSAEQASGEKKVRMLLIEPLTRRGLAKPSSINGVQFVEMVKALCSRLAYMSDANLMALEEMAASHPGGKSSDRFPIANHILEWAAQIQPPGDEVSPLIRAVFNADVGRSSITQDWAPELLGELKRVRKWPTSFMIKTIRTRAAENCKKVVGIDDRTARDATVSPDDLDFKARRASTAAKCLKISQMGAMEVVRA
jgi:hypothetical protein